jgi:hypothetical protein
LFVRTGTSKATSSGGKLLKSTSSANPDLPSPLPSAAEHLGGLGCEPSSRVPANQRVSSHGRLAPAVPMERIQTLLVEGMGQGMAVVAAQ